MCSARMENVGSKCNNLFRELSAAVQDFLEHVYAEPECLGVSIGRLAEMHDKCRALHVLLSCVHCRRLSFEPLLLKVNEYLICKQCDGLGVRRPGSAEIMDVALFDISVPLLHVESGPDDFVNTSNCDQPSLDNVCNDVTVVRQLIRTYAHLCTFFNCQPVSRAGLRLVDILDSNSKLKSMFPEFAALLRWSGDAHGKQQQVFPCPTTSTPPLLLNSSCQNLLQAQVRQSSPIAASPSPMSASRAPTPLSTSRRRAVEQMPLDNVHEAALGTPTLPSTHSSTSIDVYDEGFASASTDTFRRVALDVTLCSNSNALAMASTAPENNSLLPVKPVPSPSGGKVTNCYDMYLSPAIATATTPTLLSGSKKRPCKRKVDMSHGCLSTSQYYRISKWASAVEESVPYTPDEVAATWNMAMPSWPVDVAGACLDSSAIAAAGSLISCSPSNEYCHVVAASNVANYGHESSDYSPSWYHTVPVTSTTPPSQQQGLVLPTSLHQQQQHLQVDAVAPSMSHQQSVSAAYSMSTGAYHKFSHFASVPPATQPRPQQNGYMMPMVSSTRLAYMDPSMLCNSIDPHSLTVGSPVLPQQSWSSSMYSPSPSSSAMCIF